MKAIFSRPFLAAVLTASLMLLSGPAHAGTETGNPVDEPKLEEQFNELTDEWQRRFVDALRQLLANELNRLKANRNKPVESLQSQITDHESVLKKNPDNPSSHFALGSLYSDMGDGANAIIHMRKAERLFKEKNDVKGVAESRRSLRNYYSKFGYKPEDFNLTQ